MHSMDLSAKIDMLWLLLCAALVLLMQGGFCCLESGLVRAKNSINVAIKNLTDLCVATLLFWAVGYGLMFGASAGGFVGTSDFLFGGDARSTAVFIYMLAFCGAATTIVAGAVAERLKFSGYLLIAVVTSGVVYPVLGHWAWGDGGWLAAMGFMDYAGAIVVHGVGGAVALAAVVVLGPRLGRFGADGKPIQPNNVPLAMLGVFLLAIGWIGFNGGSELGLTQQTPHVLLATLMAGAAGAIGWQGIAWWTTGKPDVLATMNGLLAGLVASAAGAHMLSPLGAVATGLCGAGAACFAERLLIRMRVDDAISAVPVHLVAGWCGIVLLPLFASDLPEGMSRLGFLQVQVLGATTIVATAFLVTFCALTILNRCWSLRIDAAGERDGLNMAEHGQSTALLDLLVTMSNQAGTGDVDCDVHVEPHTEVGQIAAMYNGVLARIRGERAALVVSNMALDERRQSEESARAALQETVEQLERFNHHAVGRELRMLELKREVNELAETLGEPLPYDLSFDDESPSTIEARAS